MKRLNVFRLVLLLGFFLVLGACSTSMQKETAATTAEYAKGVEAIRKNDFATAIEVFQRLAKLGDASSQFNLGIMYSNGLGVSRDDEKAADWYKRAAEQGIADTQNNLGIMYQMGRGVPKNIEKALKWYRRAAEQDYAEAQFNLGLIFGAREDAARDYGKAVKWYRRAAEKGHAGAQLNFRAYMWSSLAASQGEAKARNLQVILEPEMTATQIAEAKRLAAEWRRAHGG